MDFSIKIPENTLKQIVRKPTIQISDILQDYMKTLRFDYSTTLQIEYMTNIPKILAIDDSIEGEMEYDDDGIYYGE